MSSQELEPSGIAEILARKARGDATVVRKLAPDSEVDDESIGFHAQQAVEKWLKAVVASRGEDFEYTHDLRRLIALARLDSADEPPFDVQRAVALTEYAVPLRYEICSTPSRSTAKGHTGGSLVSSPRHAGSVEAPDDEAVVEQVGGREEAGQLERGASNARR